MLAIFTVLIRFNTKLTALARVATGASLVIQLSTSSSRFPSVSLIEVVPLKRLSLPRSKAHALNMKRTRTVPGL